MTTPHRRAQTGRRFARSAPAPTRPRLPRRRREPETGRIEKLLQLVRGALPGRPKPAVLGVLGAGAAGVAMAARRRKRGAASAPAETQPQPEPRATPSSEDAD